MRPDVSVVIVTWNGRHHLDRCLSSVQAQRGVTVETILVDNGSSDGTADDVRARYPWVKLVALAENRGFRGHELTDVRQIVVEHQQVFLEKWNAYFGRKS